MAKVYSIKPPPKSAQTYAQRKQECAADPNVTVGENGELKVFQRTDGPYVLHDTRRFPGLVSDLSGKQICFKTIALAKDFAAAMLEREALARIPR